MHNNCLHPSERLLQEALVLIQHELAMLDKDEDTDFEKLALQRKKLIDQAWKERDGCNEKTLQTLLKELHAKQQELLSKAYTEHQSLRNQLSTRKKQGGYFANAQKQMAYSDKAFYMNQIS